MKFSGLFLKEFESTSMNSLLKSDIVVYEQLLKIKAINPTFNALDFLEFDRIVVDSFFEIEIDLSNGGISQSALIVLKYIAYSFGVRGSYSEDNNSIVEFDPVEVCGLLITPLSSEGFEYIDKILLKIDSIENSSPADFVSFTQNKYSTQNYKALAVVASLSRIKRSVLIIGDEFGLASSQLLKISQTKAVLSSVASSAVHSAMSSNYQVDSAAIKTLFNNVNLFLDYYNELYNSCLVLEGLHVSFTDDIDIKKGMGLVKNALDCTVKENKYLDFIKNNIYSPLSLQQLIECISICSAIELCPDKHLKSICLSVLFKSIDSGNVGKVKTPEIRASESLSRSLICDYVLRFDWLSNRSEVVASTHEHVISTFNKNLIKSKEMVYYEISNSSGLRSMYSELCSFANDTQSLSPDSPCLQEIISLSLDIGFDVCWISTYSFSKKILSRISSSKHVLLNFPLKRSFPIGNVGTGGSNIAVWLFSPKL